MSNASQSPATDSETENKEEEKKIPYLVLPYMGEKGAKIAKILKRKRMLLRTSDQKFYTKEPNFRHSFQPRTGSRTCTAATWSMNIEEVA